VRGGTNRKERTKRRKQTTKEKINKGNGKWSQKSRGKGGQQHLCTMISPLLEKKQKKKVGNKNKIINSTKQPGVV